MTHLPGNLDRMIRLFFLLLILVWMGDRSVMANDFNSGAMKPGAFSISESGGLQYGSRQMSFDGDSKFYFAKGDTINDETQMGVGVFALNLQNSDVQQLKDVVQALCDKDIQTGGPETHDPAATFTVVCLKDGKAVQRSGSLRLIPESFRHRVFDVPLRLSRQAWTDGGKLIKLDFTTLSVVKNGDHYVISVRFLNSGTRWIKFKTPDQWPGTTPGGGLGVAPYSQLGQIQPRDDWGFNLAGAKQINKDEFPDGSVFLKPGESKVLEFEAIPDNKIAKGEYDFSGVAFMRIEYEGYGWGLSQQVDFRPIKTRITIDRDYPSTAQEREQWEATHRASMSFQPVKPGETFAEDGLYRATGMSFSANQHSLQLKAFKAGDMATSEKVTMATGDGFNISGPVQWLWEATAPTPIKQWSFDMIADTVQFCKAGANCPRTGRWVARIDTGSDFLRPEYRLDLSSLVTLRRGQPMPSIRDADERAEWEWVGA
jgi:hypothetical protein